MSAPRRRMYGTGPDLRPTPTEIEFTGPTFSDDEIDELYGVTGPLGEPCTCFRDGDYFPESCNRADHHPKGDAA